MEAGDQERMLQGTRTGLLLWRRERVLEGYLGRPVSFRNPSLACTIGMSGRLGSAKTNDCCSLCKGANKELGSALEEMGRKSVGSASSTA